MVGTGEADVGTRPEDADGAAMGVRPPPVKTGEQVEEATVVALAATGVTAISVGTNAWATRWTGRNTRKQQREERHQHRLSNAYVPMLELAEKEGHYLQVWSFHVAAGDWITTVVDPPAAKFHPRRVAWRSPAELLDRNWLLDQN